MPPPIAPMPPAIAPVPAPIAVPGPGAMKVPMIAPAIAAAPAASPTSPRFFPVPLNQFLASSFQSAVFRFENSPTFDFRTFFLPVVPDSCQLEREVLLDLYYQSDWRGAPVPLPDFVRQVLGLG